MANKLFEKTISISNPDSLAQRLIDYDPEAALNLARAIEIELQDRSIWGEFAEEGINPMN